MRDGWVETSLGDVATWSSGKNISKDLRISDGKYAIVGANGVIGRTNQFLYDQPLVIVGRVGSCGETYLSDGKIWISDNALIAIPNVNIEVNFLFYLLKTFDYSQIISGTTQPLITQGKLKAQLVRLPPLPEQKRIVNLISSVDSYIDALQQQLESSKKSRNAVLHELLTADGDGWVETTLGEICTDGLFCDGDWVESKDQDPEGDYRLLQLADIGDGNFLNKSDRWMNQEQFMRLGCTKLEINDVLIARMPDPIGRACLFPEGLPVCATVVDVAIVRTYNETLQKFLVLLINSSDFRTEAFSLLTGTTRQRISRGNLAKITFKIPSPEEQLEIVNLISLFDSEITQTTRVVEEAKHLRSGLLSDLLSGEHEIPESYDKVIGAA
jgi:restriction endonuclease S subunit